jgi:hypothetical protein
MKKERKSIHNHERSGRKELENMEKQTKGKTVSSSIPAP